MRRTVITMFEAVIACFTYTFGITSLYKFRNLLDFPKELETRVAYISKVGVNRILAVDVLFNSSANLQCSLLLSLCHQNLSAHWQLLRQQWDSELHGLYLPKPGLWDYAHTPHHYHYSNILAVNRKDKANQHTGWCETGHPPDKEENIVVQQLLSTGIRLS